MNEKQSITDIVGTLKSLRASDYMPALRELFRLLQERAQEELLFAKDFAYLSQRQGEVLAYRNILKTFERLEQFEPKPSGQSSSEDPQ